MFEPDPEFQNMPMLYMPAWNGLVEGPTWDAWWIQNSYGPTYCALPFWQEPYVTFLQNSQDLWFDQMGDGKRVGGRAVITGWRPTAACATPPARAGSSTSRATAASTSTTGAWSSPPPASSCRPKPCSSAAMPRPSPTTCPSSSAAPTSSRSRRDPKNNLFLAGAGRQPAGAELRRLEEARRHLRQGLSGRALDHLHRRARPADRAGEDGRPRRTRPSSTPSAATLARKGLPLLTTDEGYFIKSLDPDGTKHGVYGAAEARLLRGRRQPRRHLLPRRRRRPGREDLRQDRLASPACAPTT